jgi:hypothetical protein
LKYNTLDSVKPVVMAGRPSLEGAALSALPTDRCVEQIAGRARVTGPRIPNQTLMQFVDSLRALALKAGDVMSADVVLQLDLTDDERLESMLQRRLGNRIRNLRVRVLPTGIVLAGWAPTYHAKQLAQHAAMELAGVPIVANDIEVR